jgi:hypothetical protein
MKQIEQTHVFRIVGGTDHTPERSQTEPRRDLKASSRISFRAPDDQTLTITNRNKRLREQREDIWRKADAATRYWRARMDLHDAIWVGQREGISEASSHSPVTPEDMYPLLNNYWKAKGYQLLTPAPRVAVVNWKQDVLAKGEYLHTGLEKEQIEKAIVDDLAFLAAHPTRRPSRRA